MSDIGSLKEVQADYKKESPLPATQSPYLRDRGLKEEWRRNISCNGFSEAPESKTEYPLPLFSLFFLMHSEHLQLHPEMRTSEAVAGQAAGETVVFHWKGCVERNKVRIQQETTQRTKTESERCNRRPYKGQSYKGEEATGHHGRAEIQEGKRQQGTMEEQRYIGKRHIE